MSNDSNDPSEEARMHDERIRLDVLRVVVEARPRNQTWPEVVEAAEDAYRWMTGREWGRSWYSDLEATR